MLSAAVQSMLLPSTTSMAMASGRPAKFEGAVHRKVTFQVPAKG